MAASLIIDMRCLQDPNYAERGIGNHARSLIAGCPRPFLGIIDPSLPPLPADLAARAQSLSPHGYVPDLAAGAIFLNPSPMGPDQLFIGRLLLDERLTKAACVHDFIPYDDQATYLADASSRLEYFSSLAWLRRYDVFFPVSRHSAARLTEIFGPVPTHVTGAPLPDWAQTPLAARAKHILMIGGDDPRKNPEFLVRAHAADQILARVPLLLTGIFDPATRKSLAKLGPVSFAERLSGAEMREAYAASWCVVIPSRAEGFSLPVIEAMAAEVPVLASDIPAHRELIGDDIFRFDPGDERRLTAQLNRMLFDPAYRARAIAAQKNIWQDFTGAKIAARLWENLLPLRTPALARRRKPELAVLSVMPDQKSGIADYSAAMVRALARHAEVTVVPPEAASPLTYLDAQKFDRVLSVIGNDPVHAPIYELAISRGSAVLCHDARLLGLVARNGFSSAAALAARELGRAVTEAEIAAWSADETKREAGFFADLAATARPLIFHSHATAETVSARFGIGAKYLPFAIQRHFPPPDPAARAAARARLGIGDEKLIVSAGFLTPDKAGAEILHAFARLRQAQNILMLFAGEATPHGMALEKQAAALGLLPHVRFGRDYLSDETYRACLLAADAAVQLRRGTGNLSGALQDAIAAGLPCVANQDLAANADAPSYVQRIKNDFSSDDVAEALARALRTPRDEVAREAYCAGHGMEGYAVGLLRILRL